jgi:hypothetical protein
VLASVADAVLGVVAGTADVLAVLDATGKGREPIGHPGGP